MIVYFLTDENVRNWMWLWEDWPVLVLLSRYDREGK